MCDDILTCSFYAAASAHAPCESFAVSSLDCEHHTDALGRKTAHVGPARPGLGTCSLRHLEANECVRPQLVLLQFLKQTVCFVLVCWTPDKHPKKLALWARSRKIQLTDSGLPPTPSG